MKRINQRHKFSTAGSPIFNNSNLWTTKIKYATDGTDVGKWSPRQLVPFRHQDRWSLDGTQ